MPHSKLFFPFSSQFLTLCGASQLLFSLHAPSEALLSLFFSIFHSLRGITASFSLHAPSEALLSLFFSIFHSLRGISASFPSPCPVRSSSFSFLLVFSLPVGHLSFFSFPMPRPKLFFLFSSRLFTLCGASQLLFLLHAPSEALVFRL